MNTTPLISMGTLIDHSWDRYRARVFDLISISSWMLTLALLNVIALSFYPLASKLLGLNVDYSGWEIFGVILYFITNLILSPFVSFWIYVALIRLSDITVSKPRSVSQAITDSKKLFLPALHVTILIGLMILFAVAIGIGIPLAVIGIGILQEQSALLTIGNLLLIFGLALSFILCIRWGIQYYFAPYSCILDGSRGKASLRASRALVSGRFWSIFARIVVPKLVFVLFGIFAIAIIGFFVEVIISFVGGLNSDLLFRLSSIAQSVIPVIVVVCINPLVILSDVILFHHLKESYV